MILTALLAAVAMVASCVLSVISVQAEAANKGWLAGATSAAGFLTSFAYTDISLSATGSARIVTLGLVFVAVVFGTKLGADVGRRILHLRLARRLRRRRLTGVELQAARQAAREFRHSRKGLM